MQSPFRYNPAFDGLRAIAAMLVLGYHCRVPGLNPSYFGVDVFFVLSGFLITRLLAEETEAQGRIDLPQFYLRRLLRLGPPLLLLLLVYLTVAPTIWPQLSEGEHLRDAALTGFYLSDYAFAFWEIPKLLRHSWSLSVEEHFYLIWPLVVLLLARCDARRRILILAGLFVLATAWRVFEYHHTGWVATYYRFDTRISGLILGALLATCLPSIGQISDRMANIIGVIACAVLVICLRVGYWRSPWALVTITTLIEMSAAGLLVSASVSQSWVSTTLSTPPLAALGVISYGVYLWHYPIAAYFRDWLPWQQAVPIVAISAIAAATVSYLTIERPLRRYRHSLGSGSLPIAQATPTR
ncbi:MAG TPA: acyltransferase [Pseudolabrys sp.]|nr:acyltransferase [Pseudolabrys sp.]